jgi:CheY-like chemotaxis protein
MLKTIVLIDDDQDDLDILQELISGIDSSFHCISFVYATEAIRVISNELSLIPDFVFTDINMPEMAGDECVKELRKMPELDNTVITVLSTSMGKDIAEGLKKSGADFVFQKPSQINAYRELLSSVLLGPR